MLQRKTQLTRERGGLKMYVGEDGHPGVAVLERLPGVFAALQTIFDARLCPDESKLNGYEGWKTSIFREDISKGKVNPSASN
jgi:hypothetical protein